jgi:ABC-type Fe3+/spermidine/putrescine transport system ATPase subunit
MNHGRLEQIGPPAELYERPRTRFVADFLGSANFLDAVVQSTGAPARLATDRGASLEVAGLDGAAIGQRVTVAIRPERIRIEAPDAPEAERRTATVRDLVYQGSVQRYQVELERGDLLVAFRPNLGEPAIAPGAQITVSWRAADAWVIPETGGSVKRLNDAAQ